MNTTKQNIKFKSKDLFNSNGIQATSLRQIAVALNISQGNLNYHYKTKQEIIEELYFELVEKIDAEISAITEHFSSLAILYTSTEKSMNIFFDYRFLLRDIYFVFRENKKIRSHYIQLQEIRRASFRSLFDVMIDQNLFRQEEFPNEYDRLYERINIIGDNWINAFELFNPSQKNPVQYYQGLLFETIYPYLTVSGKKEFAEIAF